MLNLLRMGAGLAIVLTFVSVNLWRELRTERMLTADLRALVAESANRDLAVPSTPPIDGRAGAEAIASTNDRGNPDAPPPSPDQAPAINPGIQNVYPSETDRMNDPEYRNARLTQLRMTLKRTYTDVAEELALSEAETEQLFDILAERQLGGLNNPQGRLNELLGPGRQAKWQEYQLTVPARSRATAMTAMLASSGHPLTEAQLRPLTTALIAEERYVREQQLTSPQSVRMAPEFGAEQEESVNRQEESNRRYLEAATPYMSSQQLALVRQTLEQQIAISRASARMLRERLEAAR